MTGQPERIGPYRLEARIGVGGMGEVFSAWDERLERRVALKLIRSDAAGAATRERFRREARAAAGLNHPAIVQIYDILETELGDAIVLEYVEGETLTRRVERGPLFWTDAVRLGREIAEGLAAAHAQGIVHRDLKSENVMVNREGRAKVLDFGLAKRLDPGTEPSLTQEAVLAGTPRSMSPEQARGQLVDARSDLFSLGTLLYEVASGRSPFEAGSTLDTLTRICTVRQPPLAEVDPLLPPALSQLVDRLLEKDPGRRPAGAREVAFELDRILGSRILPFESARDLERADLGATWIEGLTPPSVPSIAAPQALPSTPAYLRPRRLWRRWGLAAAAAAALAAGWLWRARDRSAAEPPRSVAVAKPQVVGEGGEAAALLAAGVREAVQRGLLSLSGLTPLSSEQVDAVAGTPVEVARAAAASEVLTSRLDCAAESCRVTLSRVRGRDGALLWIRSFAAPSAQPFLLAETVEGYLKQAYPDLAPRQGATGFEVRPGDYEEYLRLRHEIDSRQLGWSDEQMLAKLRTLHGSSPRFLEGYVLEAELLRLRFGARRDKADLDAAFAALQRARSLSPDDPRPLVAQVELGLRGERPGWAEEALAELERLQPGDPSVQAQRARLLERRGDTRQALALMRDAERQRPSLTHLSRLADMEYRLGEGEAARQHARELVARFPDYRSAKSLLGQIELNYGDPAKAEVLYGDLVATSPSWAELVNLGAAQMLQARYVEAEASLRAARRLASTNPSVVLNLADVLTLEGKKEEGAQLYHELLAMIARDPAADSWQLLSMKAQALAHLGERAKAVEGAQQILILARDNAQAAQEVAQVYVLVGDDSSAEVNAKRALRQGVEPRWFSFPWFDPLRRSAEFRALIAEHERKPASSPP